MDSKWWIKLKWKQVGALESDGLEAHISRFSDLGDLMRTVLPKEDGIQELELSVNKIGGGYNEDEQPQTGNSPTYH